MAFRLKPVNAADLATKFQSGIRSSQWRDVLDEFMASGEAAAEIELEGEVNRKGVPFKPASVAGALHAVMRSSKNAGNEYPVSVAVRGTSVNLVRSDLTANEAADAETEAAVA
jgi:hypothetical protein